MYSPALLGIIVRTVKNKEIAEEILQKTFLKVWDKIDTYDEDKSNFFTWLAVIARNNAIDQRRLVSFSNNEKTETLDSTVYEMNASVIQTEGIDTAKLLAVLDPKYKIVLDMMYLQGYSQSEISNELEIPLGTVKTRIKAALKILRKELINERSLFIGLLVILILIFCQIWL